MHESKPQHNSSYFYRFGCKVIQYYKVILLVWGLLFLGGIMLIPSFFNHLSPPQLNVKGSQSELTQKLMEHNFADDMGEQNFLVFHSNQWKVNEQKFYEPVDNVLAEIQKIEGVTVVANPMENPLLEGENQVSKDLHTCYALLFIEGNKGRVLETIDVLSEYLDAQKGGLELYLTGATPTIKDLTHMEKRDLTFAEKLGMPFVLVVLLFAFGSLTAALIPIMLGGMAVVLTFACLSLSGYQDFDIIVPSVVTMIGLGIGIDYSLFLIIRYREELQQNDSHQAIAIAIATSGKSIFLSGLTVMISLIGLPLVHAKLFLNLTVGTFAVLFILLLLTLTFLPSLLCLLGHRLNSFSIPYKKKTNQRKYLYRWTKHIMKYSLPYLIGSLLILAALTAPLLQMHLGIGLNQDALKDYPSGRGNTLLEDKFVSGLYSPVLLVKKASGSRFSMEELKEISTVGDILKTFDEVQMVSSITELTDNLLGDDDTYNEVAELIKLPELKEYTSFLINDDFNVAPLMITLKYAPDSTEAKTFVSKLNERFEKQVNEGSLYIGGLTAQVNDLHEETAKKTPIVIVVVLMISYCFLVIAFKSIFIPIKAILLNIICVTAACGMTVLVFQFGWGEEYLQFTSPGFIQSYLPVLTFAILFGLSMDYEVFLVGRIKEEWESSHDNEESIARGIESTGPFITQAALIMIIVFISFILTRVLEIKQLGFTLAIAVLLDATIIRLILVPILLKMMGKWNWWFPSMKRRFKLK
ncbi:MMPL family transporter [Bacillus sp. FJAT-27986]|uniref:MMPL family transporter n=1 Tax=Bacillus sp. FJAT-27986 TaxID=1743146 RepID=UPI00080AFC37|nr:MMPL family transporter [Bacillus sp. FJAT-27986]OCA86478.1 hypothetical protein A8L44_08730 [Bacillus sp. FJAT-27986]